METYNRIEFWGGSSIEQEIFFLPYFELRNRKMIVVSDKIPPRFYQLKSMVEKEMVYVTPDFKYYYSVQPYDEVKYLQDLSSGKIWDKNLGGIVGGIYGR